MFQAVILFVLVAEALASGGTQWKYGETENHVYGTKDWEKVSAHCSESAQSPINIETSKLKKDSNLKGLSFTFDNKDGTVSGKLINNGHAPTLAIDKAKGTASLTGGPLGDNEYKLQQLHFHFGCKGSKGGSEHTVNGIAYPVELHLVTFNTKYSKFFVAASKDDGLAVIGVFFQIRRKRGSRFPSELKNIVLRNPGNEVAVPELNLLKLVPQLRDLSRTSFYSYKGSLTTPPCYQSVNWIVLKKPIAARRKEFNEMNALRNPEKQSMCGNFRPTQPLNGRTVSGYSG